MAVKKITVLYGGQSSEREVSLESGKYIYQSIKDLGYETQLIDYPAEFLLDKFSHEDLVFIALHGKDGESGELQNHLKEQGVLYTGSGDEACKKTWNKATFKKILRENNIPTPNWISVPSLLEIKSLEDVLFKNLDLSNNIFLKPAEDGSSIDVFKISTSKDLEMAISNCVNANRQFIFENQSSTPAEIMDGIYDAVIRGYHLALTFPIAKKHELTVSLRSYLITKGTTLF